MKRLLAALLFIPAVVLGQQNTAIDRDKHTENGAPVSWLTTRTAGYDVPHVIVDSGGGGGAGAVTIADGADVTLGALADAAATTDTGTFSLQALTKRSLQKLTSISGQLPASLGAKTGAASFSIVPASDAGMATSALQTTGNTSLSTIATNTTSIATAANQTTANTSLSTIATNTTSIATAANQTTANTSLSTIATNTTGASTAANQTAEQANAGSDATKAVSIQGITSGKAVPISVAAVVSTKELSASSTNGQVTASGSPATLVASNANRRRLVVRNQDATLSVYIGEATVSSSNGTILKANESRVITSPELMQVIAPSGSPVVDYMDESY